MSDLNGKVAVVTGSGRGIGRAIALRLARDGAAVVVNDMDRAAAIETAGLVRDAGATASTVVGSVTEDETCHRLVDASTELGGVHILVNNAGYTWDAVIHKTTDEQWDAMLDVHLTGPFRLLRAAQPVVKAAVESERAAGRTVCRKVVNISSLAGIGGNAGQASYAAAKAGVVGLTKALAKEWGRLNVTVNAVAFGLISTRLTAPRTDAASIEVDGRDIAVGVNPELLSTMEAMIPLGRAGTPQEAAGAVSLLCGPDSDYVSGHTLVCSGGFML